MAGQVGGQRRSIGPWRVDDRSHAERAGHLVLLLNGLDASAGIAVASFGVVAVVAGSALGFFAERLPGFPQARRPHRLAVMHHGAL